MGSTDWKLPDHQKIAKNKVVGVVVLDGWGEYKDDQYNCIHTAETPFMDSLKKNAPNRWRLIKAHGSAVGLPTEDDMGNSEVGHNALGAGRSEVDMGNRNFTANSTYAKNRDIILTSIVSNVAVNGGFYDTIIGQAPDKVYGIGVCRGDSTSEVCNICVNKTVQDIIASCPNQKEVVSWGQDPQCIVHYADHPIAGRLELNPEVAGYNMDNVILNLTKFNEVWESLMDHLVIKASMGSSRLKFGTGEAYFTKFKKIYALMQCTPDISKNDCDNCLRQNVASFQICCSGKGGGYVNRPSCLFQWNLIPFYSVPAADFPVRDSGGGGIATAIVVIIVVSTIIIVAVFIALFCFLVRRRSRKLKISKQSIENAVEIEIVEFKQFDFSTIEVATNEFSKDNKLGQGGFGAVYKGNLSDGRTIAVKRLASISQGEREFKNEILLMTGLEHKNLARLLGFCSKGSERLLIYEFVPNSSLDSFIFNPVKSASLDWEKRYKIIKGIARGILYLHEGSRTQIIHRDLKASNILLDQHMNPKISDFGIARMFETDQTHAETERVVGTFGYIAPEYYNNRTFSVKSDVYSFGVLVLEILSGKKISDGEDLRNIAWENHTAGTPLRGIDHILRDGSDLEMKRCIVIGLLCVQEAAGRPSMATVDLMLNSYSTSLPRPGKPACFWQNTLELEYSVNENTITELLPR